LRFGHGYRLRDSLLGTQTREAKSAVLTLG
jgi:hypothetical protein